MGVVVGGEGDPHSRAAHDGEKGITGGGWAAMQHNRDRIPHRPPLKAASNQRVTDCTQNTRNDRQLLATSLFCTRRLRRLAPCPPFAATRRKNHLSPRLRRERGLYRRLRLCLHPRLPRARSYQCSRQLRLRCCKRPRRRVGGCPVCVCAHVGNCGGARITCRRITRMAGGRDALRRHSHQNARLHARHPHHLRRHCRHPRNGLSSLRDVRPSTNHPSGSCLLCRQRRDTKPLSSTRRGQSVLT